MRSLVLITLLMCGCASTPNQDTRTPDSAMCIERQVKICAFNILTGIMLLPEKGISAFESPCDENDKTKDAGL